MHDNVSLYMYQIWFMVLLILLSMGLLVGSLTTSGYARSYCALHDKDFVTFDAYFFVLPLSEINVTCKRFVHDQGYVDTSEVIDYWKP